MTYDPLAAHGLTAALAGARDAVATLTSPHPAAEARNQYQNRLDEAYRAYRVTRAEILDAEGRWPDSPFWARRRRDSSPRKVGSA